MSTKDKQKVIGEQLDATQVARFLEMEGPAGGNADFYKLLKAYRGLPTSAFEAFLEQFVARGLDINATDEQGNTLLALTQQHPNQPGYSEILTRHGAA